MFKDENKELIVRKNNKLVNARYNLTTNETKLFLMLLYKLQCKGSTLTCTIPYNEFSIAIKSKRDRTIESISGLLSELRRKPIFFMIPSGDKYKWGEYGFINGYTFNENNNSFEIEASTKIYEIVKSYLQDGFTPNNLAVLFSVRNPYTYRLYDLLRAWTGSKKVINYSIDKLKEYLMLEDKYPLYGDFKRRIITPAIKELNNTGVLTVEIEEIKISRKVESINFIVTDNDKRTGFNKPLDNLIEVDTTLKDSAGNDIPVKQTAFNVDKLQNEDMEKAPAVTPAEAQKLQLIRDSLEIPYLMYFSYSKSTLDKFTIYCKTNQLDFSKEPALKKIMEMAIERTKDKTNQFDITESNYKYFINTFEGIKREQLEEIEKAEMNKIMYDLVNGKEEIKDRIEEQHKELCKELYLEDL